MAAAADVSIIPMHVAHVLPNASLLSITDRQGHFPIWQVAFSAIQLPATDALKGIRAFHHQIFNDDPEELIPNTEKSKFDLHEREAHGDLHDGRD